MENQELQQYQSAIDQIPQDVITSLVLSGDLSRMNDVQKVQYYNSFCTSLKLNPLTQPFEIINLKGKLRMYAKKDATDQLRKIYKVSVIELEKTQIGEIYIVTAKGQDASGRIDSATGAVSITGLQGENLANALMKAESKAKRRLTLSLCGLGILDETEVESVKNAESYNDTKKESGYVDLINPQDQAVIDKFAPMLDAINNPIVPDSLFAPQTKEQFIESFKAEFMSGSMPIAKADGIYNTVSSYFNQS